MAVRFTRGAAYTAFAIAVALATGWSLRNGFVYDDLPAIVQNTRVTDPSLWHTIPRSPYWLGTLWRPLTVFLFAVQWYAGHGAPWLFHAVSLLAYLATGVVLFRLTESLGAGRLAAAVAAGLFLVHPVHVEAVANVVGQSELWVGLALLAATAVYVRARERGTEVRLLPALLVLVALGITAKEQGFVVVLLLAGAEWLLLAGRGDRPAARFRLLIPVAALSVLLFVLRGMLLDSYTGETPAAALRALSPLGRAVTFLGVVPEWARLAVWPIHLQADYGPPGIPVGGAMTLRHWLGVALLGGYVALFLRWRRRRPVAAFGLWWTAIALAPVSNLLAPTGIVMAERVLFVPTIGLAIVGAALIREPQRTTQREWLGVSVIVAWGLVMTVRSAVRVPTWSSQERFFTDITVDAADDYRAWKVAAGYWDDAHDRPRAIADFLHAIALWPHDYETGERLGQIYRRDGRCDLAIPVFAAGLGEDPSATSLRAKLIECQMAVRDWDGAAMTAHEGVALGHDEFRSVEARVARLRDSAAVAR